MLLGGSKWTFFFEDGRGVLVISHSTGSLSSKSSWISEYVSKYSSLEQKPPTNKGPIRPSTIMPSSSARIKICQLICMK
jgi:hypothetical protein